MGGGSILITTCDRDMWPRIKTGRHISKVTVFFLLTFFPSQAKRFVQNKLFKQDTEGQRRRGPVSLCSDY